MILLGHGIYSVNGKDIALVRGGGSFNVERDYREIEADGDKGPVKDRITLDRSVPKLTLNALSLIPEDFSNYYPATTVTTTESSTKITGKADIESSDYTTVTFTGKTKDNKKVVITIKNAINLENLEWELKDKDEVVPELNFTGAYLEDDDSEPWEIEYFK